MSFKPYFKNVQGWGSLISSPMIFFGAKGKTDPKTFLSTKPLLRPKTHPCQSSC